MQARGRRRQRQPGCNGLRSGERDGVGGQMRLGPGAVEAGDRREIRHVPHRLERGQPVGEAGTECRQDGIVAGLGLDELRAAARNHSAPTSWDTVG